MGHPSSLPLDAGIPGSWVFGLWGLHQQLLRVGQTTGSPGSQGLSWNHAPGFRVLWLADGRLRDCWPPWPCEPDPITGLLQSMYLYILLILCLWRILTGAKSKLYALFSLHMLVLHTRDALSCQWFFFLSCAVLFCFYTKSPSIYLRGVLTHHNQVWAQSSYRTIFYWFP